MRNLTPEKLRCTYSASCPGVYQLEDGSLLIVGKSAPFFANEAINDGNESARLILDGWRKIADTIGTEEECIVVHPDLLSDYVKQAKEKADE